MAVYPNPAGNTTVYIDIDIFKDENISLQLFNGYGQSVARIEKGFLLKGHYQYRTDVGKLIPPGVYLLVFTAGKTVQTSKLVVNSGL